MTELNAIKCANHLAETGLKYGGSNHDLSFILTSRWCGDVEERLLFRTWYMNPDMPSVYGHVVRTFILKECREYIYDYKDFRQVVKAFLKREFNVRMNGGEHIDVTSILYGEGNVPFESNK